jgi:DNA-binding MarR family transcriptional regulator
MPTSPPILNTQVIGQAESALGAILDPLLSQADLTPPEWFVLALTTAGGGAVGRDALVGRVAAARKLPEAEVLATIDGLAAVGLVDVQPADQALVTLTGAGRLRYQQVRERVDEITARLFGDLPAADLATAGRVLAIVTDRANAEIKRFGG